MKSILEHSARIWALSACLVLGFTLEARAQGEFRAWVGLYDPGQLGWLENENRIDEGFSHGSARAPVASRGAAAAALGDKRAVRRLEQTEAAVHAVTSAGGAVTP